MMLYMSYTHGYIVGMRNTDKIIAVRTDKGITGTAVPLFQKKEHACRLKHYICENHAATGAFPGRPISSCFELTVAICADKYDKSDAYATRHVHIIPISAIMTEFISVVGNMDVIVFDEDGEHEIVTRKSDHMNDRVILERILVKGRAGS